MAIVAAVLFVALAPMAEGSKTHFTAYDTADCSGGTVGEITETTNKQYELRWDDSPTPVMTNCNNVDCRGPGSACGMSPSINVTCPATSSGPLKVNVFKKTDCSQDQLGYYTFIGAQFVLLASGQCATATYTSTWSTCGSTYTSACDSTKSVIITGAAGVPSTLCPAYNPPAPPPGAAGSAGSPGGASNTSGTNGTTAAPKASTSNANLPLNFLAMPLAMVMGAVSRLV